MKKFHNCCVKTSIALDNGGIDDVIEGHQNINVIASKSMRKFSECNPNTYNYIYIDYHRANDAYLSEHMLTESFFTKSVPLLWKTLMTDGKI